MRDGTQEDRRQGPLAVLALLLGILLASSPAAATGAQGAGGAIRLAEPELVKPAAALRGTARAGDEDRDDDPLALARPGGAVTAARLLYTSAAAPSALPLSAPAPAAHPYHARAPPAA